MKPIFVDARDISDAWCQSLWNLVEHGRRFKIDHGSYAGQERIELDFVTIHIKYPDTRPLLPKLNCGIPEPASEEYLQDYMVYLLTEYVKPDEEYTYGQFIVPQMTKIIERYRFSGHRTNQCTMQIGNENSINQTDPPCLRLIDTRIQDNKLHFYLYFRSWDCWGGLPVNLAGLQLVKKFMAGEIGVEDGEIIVCSKGLHIYDHAESIVRSYLRR